MKFSRLKGRKKISNLFENGSFKGNKHLKVVYLKKQAQAEGEIEIGFSVPKRNFKRAADRNLIKRRMRAILYSSMVAINPKFNFEIMIVYSSDELLEYRLLERSLLNLIDAICLKK